jgi:hypothetical protein
MVTYLRSKPSTEKPAHDPRQSLILEETRFLLQGNDSRFSRQLQARLLEEGCNLPSALARPLFCRHLVSSLKAELVGSAQASFDRRFPESHERLIHPHFHDAIRFFHSRLPDANTKMTKASIDAVAAVMATWYLDEAALTESPACFEVTVRQAVDRIIDSSSTGPRLAQLSLDVVVHRLRLALTASLLRHVRSPEGFRTTFGSIPRVFKEMQENPAVFCRVMSFLQDQLPYFGHLSTQVFWRTLNHLDTCRRGPFEAV